MKGEEEVGKVGVVVCVTGASGHIASWLTKHLLKRGYTVNATVRNLNDRGKIEHLLSLEGAKERLRLFEANLLEDGSFDKAVEGCEGVFHTASPCVFLTDDAQADLIDPAVKGTLNVLKSCTKASKPKPLRRRVVLTSSMSTALLQRKLSRSPSPSSSSPTAMPMPIVAYETLFSDPQYLKEIQQWYALSKTLAEEAAWKYAREKGIDLVTIHPGMVLGPLLQPKLHLGAASIANLIDNDTYPNTSMGWVHVDDVARAHILAFESASASGRYCVVGKAAHMSEVVVILKDLYPTLALSLPNRCADGKSLDMYVGKVISTEKSKSLGINSYIPLRVALKDTVDSLKDHKLIIA